MKNKSIFLLLVVFASSLACQFLMPSRTGTVISDCVQIVLGMGQLQSGGIPEHLSETGTKQGDELDVNQYFVEFITFTKWGGFYRETCTISRGFPHTIMDVKQENIVPYDCGVAF